VRPAEPAGALDDPDALALEQLAAGGGETPDDAADALPQQLEVDGRDLDLDAHARSLADIRVRAAGGDHGLGRHAVPEVGGAAHDVALDERDLGTQTGRVGGGLRARRATADDDEPQGHGSEAIGSGVDSRRRPAV